MDKADLVIKSSNIWTGGADETISGGVAVKDNRIIYVGFQDLEKFIGNSTKVLDYGEKLVIPGIHDAHVHALPSTLVNSGKLANLFEAKSEEECVELVKKIDKPENKLDGWLLGMGWYQLLWDKKDLPTRHSLDVAFPNTPVLLVDGNGHTAWVNTAGLKKLGISEDDPRIIENSDYEKDKNGHLTGILTEAASMRTIAARFTADKDKNPAMMEEFIHRANTYGITQIDDVAGSSEPNSDQIDDQSWKKLYDNGKLTVRVNVYPTLLDDYSRVNKMLDTFGRAQGDSMLGVAGFKSFFDGVSSVHTAYLSEPYSDATSSDDRGFLTVAKEDMQRRVLKAAEKDFSVRIHAIGDGAVSAALDVFGYVENRLGEDFPQNVQYAIEHLENIEESDIERLRDLNVIASVQPGHALIDPAGEERDLGPVRTKMMWPFRHYLARGVRMCFGTDSPVIDINPFENIYNAVTRKSIHGGPAWESQNSISVSEALRAYTYGAAGPANRQKEVGKLQVGKLADIAVLNTNILECAPEDIIHTKAVMTMVDGKVVYEE